MIITPWKLVFAAIVLAIWFDVLFYKAIGIGLNVFLFELAILAILFLFTHKKKGDIALQEWVLGGFGIAFSLASIIQLILLWAPLHGRLGSLQEFAILRSLFVMTTAGMLSALVIQLLKPISVTWFSLDTFFGVLFQGLFAGGIGLLVYGFVAWYLGSPEMRDFLGALQKKIGKKFIPSEPISIDG